MDCQGAEEVLRLLLAGVPVGKDELIEAQSHLESCPICAARCRGRPHRWPFFGKRAPARKPRPAAEPAVLVERALIAALSDREAIVRARAAEALAVVAEPGREAISALLLRFTIDRDEGVRSAAEAALGRLLERASSLALEPSAARGEPVLNLGGDDISGQVTAEGGELRLKLNTLPPEAERTKPVVYLPAAFGRDLPSIEWHGEESGLVQADEVVRGGEVEIRLGSLREPGFRQAPASSRPPEELFTQVHLFFPARA